MNQIFLIARGAALTTIVLTAAVGCAARGRNGELAGTRYETPVDWVGIYASPSEIGGFSGTVLALERSFGDDDDELSYRMRSYSDVVSDDEIEQDVRFGSVMTAGEQLYVAGASGGYIEGKPLLVAHLTRYTRRQINGHVVLLRDDALRVFERENKLYDYGILILVSKEVDWKTDFDAVEHPSIKLLYEDQTRGWHDPYVQGPNAR